jgi:hypothetical protein
MTILNKPTQQVAKACELFAELYINKIDYITNILIIHPDYLCYLYHIDAAVSSKNIYNAINLQVAQNKTSIYTPFIFKKVPVIIWWKS